MDPEYLCEQCGHPSDPHRMLPPTGKMKDGLVMLCPVVGCECSQTVSVGGRIPDPSAVAAMRERFQRPPRPGAEG